MIFNGLIPIDPKFIKKTTVNRGALGRNGAYTPLCHKERESAPLEAQVSGGSKEEQTWGDARRDSWRRLSVFKRPNARCNEPQSGAILRATRLLRAHGASLRGGICCEGRAHAWGRP